jgi:hypothetical protein
MTQTAVVVAFTSRCGTTEAFAHAAAVGTVNARTLPRLRRLPDDNRPARPDCADSLRRMQKEYVPPTEADIIGSPALIVIPSAGMTPASEAWQPFFALLDRLASSGVLAGKTGAVIDAGNNETVAQFSSELAARGFTIVPADGRDARAHGRVVGATVLGAAGLKSTGGSAA